MVWREQGGGRELFAGEKLFTRIISGNYLFANNNYLQTLFLRIFSGGDQAGKALPGKNQPGYQNSTQGCICITSLAILIIKVGDFFHLLLLVTKTVITNVHLS